MADATQTRAAAPLPGTAIPTTTANTHSTATPPLPDSNSDAGPATLQTPPPPFSAVAPDAPVAPNQPNPSGIQRAAVPARLLPVNRPGPDPPARSLTDPTTPTTPTSPVVPGSPTHAKTRHSRTASLVSLARRATGRHRPAPAPTAEQAQTGAAADSPTIAMQSPNGDIVTVDPTSAPTAQPLHPSPSLPLMHSAPYNAARIGKVLRDKTHMFLSTQRTQYRSRWVTVKTPRFLLRVAQFIVSFMAVVALYTATFGVNYTSTSIGVSGINLASLTCVTSVVLTLTHLFNHMFPKTVGIRPSEEGHYSAVELALDAIYFALWALSASWQAANGSCPKFLFRLGNTPEAKLFASKSPEEQERLLNVDCLPWNVSWAFGYANAILFLWSAIRGLNAWRKERAARELFFL